jgi:hypothetical protein
VRGSIEVFFNGVGVFLRFEVEEGQGFFKGGKGGPLGPGSGAGGSGGSSSGGGGNDYDNFQKGDKAKKGQGKFDRIGNVDKERESSMEESIEGHIMEESQDANPIAAFHPELGLVDMPSSLQLDKNEEQSKLDKGHNSEDHTVKKMVDESEKTYTLMPNPDSQIVVHGRGPILDG